MKIKYKIFYLFIIMLFSFFALTSCNENKKESKLFKVMLINNGEFNVLEETFVSYGDSCEIKFTLNIDPEGKIFTTSLGELTCDNDIYSIYIENVIKPLTIEVNIEQLKDYYVILNDDKKSTKVIKQDHHLIPDNKAYEGEQIHLNVDFPQEEKFLCWSLNDTINNGGSVLSYYSDYTFEINKNYNIFANYISDEYDYYQYELNGGKVLKSNSNSFKTLATSKYHSRINTCYPEDVYREGYVLTGWNTKKDGSGETIGLGSRYTVKNKKNILYAIWEKCSDINLFEYEEYDDYVYIKKYLGNEHKVVIPEKINNKSVSNLCKNSFNNFDIQEVILPHTITTIEPEAFIDCSKLERLTFFDNIKEIGDSSFKNTYIKYLSVNAIRKPTNVQEYGYKILDCYDRVLLSDKPNIILLGGSTAAFGFDSDYLSSLFKGKYTVTNFGWNAYRPMAFLMGVVNSCISEGDILIHAGEIDFPAQYCTDIEFQSNLWGVCEGNYDILKDIDISILNNVFTSFEEYNLQRDELLTKTYDEPTGYKINGDVGYYRENTDDSKLPSRWFKLDKSVFSTNGFNIMNSYYKNMRKNNVKVYESFGTLNKDIIVNTSDELSELENIVRENLDVPLISHLENYFFDFKYMDDGNIHHLSSEGSIIRTQRIYVDIKQQMEMGKNG